MYDFAVVGGGIAGLAIAELLQRSGRSVVLLEAEDKVCAQSSGQQQGWFHTGALYAALPSGRSFRHLVGNLDDLLNYYSCFPNMNLSAGRQLLTRTKGGWFRNSSNYYMYASPRDPSIRWWQNPLWRLAILRAQTRLSWFETIDFTRELSPQVEGLTANFNLSRCVSRRRFDFTPGLVDKTFKSRDRTINTKILISDLLNSFLSHGGHLRTGVRIQRIEKNAAIDQDGAHKARNIVVASGRNAQDLTGIKTKVWKSPLLVVKPAVSDVNFIWMNPNIDQTFNHMHHQTRHGDYSLFGNAAFWPVDEEIDEDEVRATLTKKAERVFGRQIDPSQTSLYFGFKTELVEGQQARNYQYQIVETDNGVLALPGKLSLAFSLAVNLCRHFGVDPVLELQEAEENRQKLASDILIRDTEHFERFMALP